MYLTIDPIPYTPCYAVHQHALPSPTNLYNSHGPFSPSSTNRLPYSSLTSNPMKPPYISKPTLHGVNPQLTYNPSSLCIPSAPLYLYIPRHAKLLHSIPTRTQRQFHEPSTYLLQPYKNTLLEIFITAAHNTHHIYGTNSFDIFTDKMMVSINKSG